MLSGAGLAAPLAPPPKAKAAPEGLEGPALAAPKPKPVDTPGPFAAGAPNAKDPEGAALGAPKENGAADGGPDVGVAAPPKAKGAAEADAVGAAPNVNPPEAPAGEGDGAPKENDDGVAVGAAAEVAPNENGAADPEAPVAPTAPNANGAGEPGGAEDDNVVAPNAKGVAEAEVAADEAGAPKENGAEEAEAGAAGAIAKGVAEAKVAADEAGAPKENGADEPEAGAAGAPKENDVIEVVAAGADTGAPKEKEAGVAEAGAAVEVGATKPDPKAGAEEAVSDLVVGVPAPPKLNCELKFLAVEDSPVVVEEAEAALGPAKENGAGVTDADSAVDADPPPKSDGVTCVVLAGVGAPPKSNGAVVLEVPEPDGRAANDNAEGAAEAELEGVPTSEVGAEDPNEKTPGPAGVCEDI